ncbi:O-antigen ligase family protein [Billgrantia sp. LNSP4103-1]|uniref:O-antigen ligase family protein n=1 Tax=Billgrantia sp. LNSP4103-1 TaxID=3410266 RepID=UPI00403FAFB2
MPAIFMYTFDLSRIFVLFFLLVFAVFGWKFSHTMWLFFLNKSIKTPVVRFAILFVTIFFILTMSEGYLALSLLELFSFLFIFYTIGILIFLLKISGKNNHWYLFGSMLIIFFAAYIVYVFDAVYVKYYFIRQIDFTPGFTNIRHFSDVAAGLMPLALLYVVCRSRPSLIAAFLSFLPLSVWWYVLFITEGRAGILSLVLSTFIALVLFGRAAQWPVATLFSSALAGLAGWWFINPLRKSADGAIFLRNITSDSNRFDLWRTAIQYGLENFPLGIGPMQFAGDGRISYAHAHNLILNTAAEWGIPLALMLLALIIYGCWKIYQRSRVIPEADKPVYACLVMAFVGVMVNVQFAGAHIFPLSSLVMVLAIGLVFGYRDSQQPPMQRPAGPVPIQATLLWAGMMLMMAYLLYAGMELYWLSVDSRTLCMQEAGRPMLYPRFWTQGRLECMQMVAPDHWLFWSWR